MDLMKKRGRHTGCLFFRNVPEDVKNLFKGTCARRGETMQLVITALMKKYIEAPEAVLNYSPSQKKR